MYVTFWMPLATCGSCQTQDSLILADACHCSVLTCLCGIIPFREFRFHLLLNEAITPFDGWSSLTPSCYDPAHAVFIKFPL